MFPFVVFVLFELFVKLVAGVIELEVDDVDKEELGAPVEVVEAPLVEDELPEGVDGLVVFELAVPEGGEVVLPVVEGELFELGVPESEEGALPPAVDPELFAAVAETVNEEDPDPVVPEELSGVIVTFPVPPVGEV